MAKTYKIQVQTWRKGGNDGYFYDFYEFTTDRKPTKRKCVGDLFDDALKAAIKDWVKADPDDAEEAIVKYGCEDVDREDYKSLEKYVLAGLTTKVIPAIPDDILAAHGIKDITEDFIELEGNEEDPFFG